MEETFKGISTGTQPYHTIQYKPSNHRTYIWVIMVGIIILLIGGMISASWGFLNPPDSSSSSSSSSSTDRQNYNNNVRLFATIGNLVQYIGILIIGSGLCFGALKDESLPANTRLGMLVAMGLIIGFKIVNLYTMYGSSLYY